MFNNNNGYSLADIAAATGGNGFGGDGSWWMLILFLFAFGGWGGMGGFGGGFGGFGNMMLGYDFPWLLNGQNGINNNVSNGFRDAQLNDGISSIRDGISGISNQLCSGFAGTTAAVTNAQNAISTQMYSNELASLNRSFAEQTANTQGFTSLQGQLAQCCCDNRAGLADLKYTVATEACADRAAVNDALRDVIAANTASTQRILDQMCADKIDAKNDEIAQLRQELLYARSQASQDVQTARILAGQTTEVDALYDRLNNCPVGTVPVYGRQPIFSCNNGCGCGNGNFYN